MRILLFHYNAAAAGLGGGGAESQIADLMAGLRLLGHEVGVAHGSVRAVYDDFHPDIIHFHTLHVSADGLAPLLWAQKNQIPHGLSLHDYWPFCFAPGQKLLVDYLPREVSTIHVGESVLSGGGQSSIVNVFRREYDGDVVAIKPQGLLPITMTEDHPVLVVQEEQIHRPRRVNGWRKYNRKIGVAQVGDTPFSINPEWVRAGDLCVGDYLCIQPISEERDWHIDLNQYATELGGGAHRRYGPIDVDEDVAYLFGWYLAEGCADRWMITLCCGDGDSQWLPELMDIVRHMGYKPSLHRMWEMRAIKMQFACQPLARYLKHTFGPNAREKRLPKEALLLPKAQLRAFVLGYLRGDGCITRHGTRTRAAFSTASQDLANTLCLALMKLGIMPYVQFTPPDTFAIRGKSYTNTGHYTISISGNQLSILGIESKTKISKRRFEFVDGIFYVPIAGLKREAYRGTVYNLETENHLIDVPFRTHNCGGRMLLKERDESCAAVKGICDRDCEQDVAPIEYSQIVNRSPVVVFNPYSAEIYKRNGIRVDTIIPHGIDTDYFSPDYDKRPKDVVRIVTTSAWPEFPTKGMHILSKAAKLAKVKVDLVAHVSRKRVRDELRASHIFVFPSCYEETFGLCLTEAMSCGCACIASDVAGSRAQILPGVTGLLYPPRDPCALADAIHYLVEKPDERESLGRNAYELARRTRRFDKMASCYVKWYEGLVRPTK